MRADLDTLLIAVYCTADDLLPERAGNARRRITDGAVVTLCVARSIMGIPSGRRFLAVAQKRLSHLFSELPQQPAFHNRRARLVRTIEWLIGMFAVDSPGLYDDVILLDSTPVECGRSLETVRRPALAHWAGYGYSKSHSRLFWGMRLHLAAAPDGTPKAWALVGADRPEREVALKLLPHALAGQEQALICDKGHAGRELAAKVRDLGPVLMRRTRQTEPDTGLHLSTIRERIESIFWTCKDLLTLERHGARTITKPLRPRRQPAAHTRRMHLAQPPARTTEPLTRGLCRLSGWNQSSRRPLNK